MKVVNELKKSTSKCQHQHIFNDCIQINGKWFFTAAQKLSAVQRKHFSVCVCTHIRESFHEIRQTTCVYTLHYFSTLKLAKRSIAVYYFNGAPISAGRVLRGFL